MADLCPERAPLEGSLSFRVVHDSNPLSGAGSSTVTIRGDRFQLSDDAVAKAVTGVVAEGSLAYNRPIGDGLYQLVPTADFLVGKFSGEAADQQIVGGGVFLRRRGDIVDFRFGPTVNLDVTGGELHSRSSGAAAFGSIRTSENRGLYFGLDMTAGTDLDAAHDGDFVAWSGYLTMLAPVPGTALTGSIGINATRLDQSGAREDLSSAGIKLGLRGMLATEIGFDLSAGYTRIADDGEDPIFGVVRRDDIVSIGGAVSFYRMETPLFGRPSVGVTYTASASTLPTKEYDRIRMSFGFTRDF